MSTQTENRTVEITGNTYPVKDQLKAIGARWNAGLKAWFIDAAKAEEAQNIVAGAGPAKPRTGYTGATRGYRSYGARRGGYSERKWCYCTKPIDEGDGECMKCGYNIKF